jgi:hypothetical protein
VVASLLLVVVAAALAAKPIKGATYKGSAPNGDPVQFKVSATGKKVSGFTVTFAPIGCQGVAPKVSSSGSAKITSKGTFKVSLVMYFPPTQPSRHVGTLVMTGTFGKHGKETGKLRSQFSGADFFSTSCDTTVAYSTKG